MRIFSVCMFVYPFPATIMNLQLSNFYTWKMFSFSRTLLFLTLKCQRSSSNFSKCCTQTLSTLVCLFVCLFVCLSISGHNNEPTALKFSHMKHIQLLTNPIVFDLERSKVKLKVTDSKKNTFYFFTWSPLVVETSG